MSLAQYTPHYQTVEGGWVQARLREIPGVITAAPTQDQAAELLADALREYLATSQWWTADQCATHRGIARKTWHRYVLAGREPAHDHHDPRTGERLWAADTVTAWHRPGRGARTDLRTDTHGA